MRRLLRRLSGAPVSLGGAGRQPAAINHGTGAAALSGPIHPSAFPSRPGSGILGMKRGKGRKQFSVFLDTESVSGGLGPDELDLPSPPFLFCFLSAISCFFLPLSSSSRPGPIYHRAISRSTSPVPHQIAFWSSLATSIIFCPLVLSAPGRARPRRLGGGP